MEVFINDLKIDAVSNYKQQVQEDNSNARIIIHFDFKVSSEDSHRVTTELYKNDFLVRVPEKNLEFNAVIHNYSTSITDLSVTGAVGDFKLSLIEK